MKVLLRHLNCSLLNKLIDLLQTNFMPKGLYDYCQYLRGRIQGGGGAGGPDPPPLKNHKNIGFLSNTGPDPCNIKKPALNVGPCQRFRLAADRDPL